MDIKTCPRCNQTKNTTEFNPRFYKKTGEISYCWCKSCTNQAAKKYYLANQKAKVIYAREYRKKNVGKYRASLVASKAKLRLFTLKAYSSEIPSCVCCNELEIKFLAIDHINGGGHKHMLELKLRGQNFYRWLKNNNYPKGYQVLCHNCNMAKGFYGKCPHTSTE